MTQLVKRISEQLLGTVPQHRRFRGPNYTPVDQSWYLECSEVRFAELALKAGINPIGR